MMPLDQLGIVLFGVTAVALSQSPREAHRRLAPFFGLAGQPFWFWSALSAGQLGVFVVCCLYTAAWGRGLWSHWIRPRLQRRSRLAVVSFVPAAAHVRREERIYLAGPVSGMAQFNRPAFAAWAARLRACGYAVVDPTEHHIDPTSHHWLWWMRRALRLLLDCDRVAFMPGWQGSAGACLEHLVAKALQMRPIYLRGAP